VDGRHRGTKIEKGAALTFSGGQSIAIFDESKTLTGRATAGQTENNQIDQMAIVLTGYTFRSKILNVTPAELHWFSSRQHMASGSTYIAIKSLDARYLKGGVYSFQTPWFRGFQIGSPSSSASPDEPVMIEFYGPEDLKIRMIISSHHAASKPSQSDLSQTISTLQPVRPAESR